MPGAEETEVEQRQTESVCRAHVISFWLGTLDRHLQGGEGLASPRGCCPFWCPGGEAWGKGIIRQNSWNLHFCA